MPFIAPQHKYGRQVAIEEMLMTNPLSIAGEEDDKPVNPMLLNNSLDIFDFRRNN